MNTLSSILIAILWPILAVAMFAAFLCFCVSEGLSKWSVR